MHRVTWLAIIPLVRDELSHLTREDQLYKSTSLGQWQSTTHLHHACPAGLLYAQAPLLSSVQVDCTVLSASSLQRNFFRVLRDEMGHFVLVSWHWYGFRKQPKHYKKLEAEGMIVKTFSELEEGAGRRWEICPLPLLCPFLLVLYSSTSSQWRFCVGWLRVWVAERRCHGAFCFLLPWRAFGSHFLNTEVLTLSLLTAGSSRSGLLYDIFLSPYQVRISFTQLHPPTNCRFCLACTEVLYVKEIAIWSGFLTALCFLLCLQMWESQRNPHQVMTRIHFSWCGCFLCAVNDKLHNWWVVTVWPMRKEHHLHLQIMQKFRGEPEAPSSSNSFCQWQMNGKKRRCSKSRTSASLQRVVCELGWSLQCLDLMSFVGQLWVGEELRVLSLMEIFTESQNHGII